MLFEKNENLISGVNCRYNYNKMTEKRFGREILMMNVSKKTGGPICL